MKSGSNRSISESRQCYASKLTLLLVGLIATLGFSSRPSDAQSYTPTAIDTTSTGSAANGLNASHVVVGNSGSNAISWSASTGTTTLFAGNAFGINAAGEICGLNTTGAVLYKGGTASVIAGKTIDAMGINATGSVAGRWKGPAFNDPYNPGSKFYLYDAYVWVPTTSGGTTGTLKPLGLDSFSGDNEGDANSKSSQAFGINDSGEAVGTVYNTTDYGDSDSFYYHNNAFIYTSGSGVTDIPPVSGETSDDGLGISGNGAVAGESDLLGTEPTDEGQETVLLERHAFVWTPSATNGTSGTTVDLGNLGTASADNATFANSVNNLGTAVGTSNGLAFVWDSVNGIRDLNTLISSGSGWTLTAATQIKDDGSIVGTGTFGGVTQGFLLTPGTPSATLMLSPSSIYGGAPSYGKVTLANAAGGSGVVANLSTTSSFITLPASVTIPAGETSATFAITTDMVTAQSAAVVTATVGSTNASSALTLLTKYEIDGNVTNNTNPAPGASIALSGSGSFLLTKNLATSQVIPDNNSTGITQSFTVPNTGTLTDIKVGVNITHPHIADLVVTLIGPDGTSVAVHNRTGNSAHDIITDFPGLTTPDASLSAFNGKQVSGAWKLKVQDRNASDTGTLNAWDVTFTYNGTVTASTTTDSSGNYSFTGLKPTTYTITPTLQGASFSDTDQEAQVPPSQMNVDFQAYSDPQVTSFSPTSGGPGSVVTITGKYFTTTSSVLLNNSQMNFTFHSDTELTATVPSGATSGPIKVNTGYGPGVSSQNFTVTSTVTPTVSTLSPTYAYAVGNDFTLTVNGTGFASGSIAKFGSTSLATTFVSATQLTATVTAALRGTAGTYNISVVNPNTTVSNLVAFTIKPRLTGFSLSKTRIAGGAPVTGTVTLNFPAPTGGLSIALSSSATSVATVPGSVVTAAGATTATFTVTTASVTATKTATITANGGGATPSVVLTVLKPVNVSASGDTYGQDGSTANTNYGTGIYLYVKDASSPGTNRESFIQFSLTGVTNITSATLQLATGLSGSGPLQTNIYETASNWSESTLTWNNKPTFGTSLGYITTSITARTTQTLDVTSYVQAQLSSGKVSFGLNNSTTSSNGVDISSREGSAGPLLIIGEN